MISYVRSHFFSGKLSSDHQLAFDHLETDLGKRQMLSALKSFGQKISDGNFQGFLEHVGLCFKVEVAAYMD